MMKKKKVSWIKMDGKIYTKLLYGNTNDPNCSNLGDRILQWTGLYKFVDDQGLLDDFEFLLPKDHWIEYNYFKLQNSVFVDKDFDDSNFVKLKQSDFMNKISLDPKKNYTVETGLLKYSHDVNTLVDKLFVELNPIQEKIRKLKNKTKKKFISFHIRKNYGIIGSEYSVINNSGYPDFTWKYYDTILKKIHDNYDVDIYIGCDLPIHEVKKHISIPFYSRLDIIPEEKEIEIYQKGDHEITFVDANMTDWLSFYYSDVLLRAPYSSFSETASLSSPFATEINILQYDHDIFNTLDGLCKKRKKVI